MNKFLIFFSVLFLSSTVHAIPVQWDMNNIQLWDPGLNLNPLTGPFIYDADIQLVSGVSITGLPAIAGSTGALDYGFDFSGDESSIYFLQSAVTSEAELEAHTGFAHS